LYRQYCEGGDLAMQIKRAVQSGNVYFPEQVA
jgi:hypothetical protein